MFNLIKGIAGLLLLISAIIYYQTTKNYSLKYKSSFQIAATIITGLSALNLLLEHNIICHSLFNILGAFLGPFLT